MKRSRPGLSLLMCFLALGIPSYTSGATRRRIGITERSLQAEQEQEQQDEITWKKAPEFTSAPTPHTPNTPTAQPSLKIVFSSEYEENEREMTLAVSLLYDPQGIHESIIKDALLQSFQTMFCAETDVDLLGTTSSMLHFNICNAPDAQFITRRRSRNLKVDSFVQAEPITVKMHRQGQDSLEWTVWTLSYRVMSVGEVFRQGALQNAEESADWDMEISSLENMNQVVQLALDISILEGKFDRVLAETLEHSVQVQSSIVGREVETFSPSITAVEIGKEEFWKPIRIAGLSMVCAISVVGSLLIILASRKRRQLDNMRQEQTAARNKKQFGLHIPRGGGTKHPIDLTKDYEEDEDEEVIFEKTPVYKGPRPPAAVFDLTLTV
jgi:hypothetical protein